MTQVTQADPDGTGPLASPVFAYQYEGGTLLTAATDARNHTTTYGHDAFARLALVTQPDPDGTGPLASPQVDYAYDAKGNLTSATDPLGHTTAFEYDGLDRRVKQTDPDPDAAGPQTSPVTTFGYDLVGNLVSRVDPLGHATTYVYDNLDRPTETHQPDPDGAGPLPAPVTTFAYDPAGNLLSLTDAAGNLTTYGYDGLNRRTSETNALGQARTTAYDAMGNVVGATDRDGRTRSWAYDNLNRATDETWADAAGTVTNVIHSAYDAKGRLTSVADDPSAYAYTYDNADRLTGIDNLGTPNAPRITQAFGYDKASNRVFSETQVGGATDHADHFAFDNLNRLIEQDQSGAGVAEKRVDYAYDAAGRMTGMARYGDLAGTSLVAGTSNAYDDDNRLTGITHTPFGGSPIAYAMAYDAASRLVSKTDADGTTNYAYDADDQLLGAADPNAPAGDEAYSYDANGNRTSAGYGTGADNRLLSDDAYDYAYDAEGNRTSRTDRATGAADRYAYDERNRVTGITAEDAAGAVTGSVAYAYDALDRRIAKSADANGDGAADSAERYSWDGANLNLVLGGGASGAVTHRMLSRPGTPGALADEEAGKPASAADRVAWDLADREGTVRDVVGNGGVALDHLRYDGFGNVTGQTDASHAPRHQFAGLEWDADAGLYYAWHRYYDAGSGRFVTQDPIGFGAGDGNLYRYAGNDPVNGIDPSGLAYEATSGGGGGRPPMPGVELAPGVRVRPDGTLEVTGEGLDLTGGAFSGGAGEGLSEHLRDSEPVSGRSHSMFDIEDVLSPHIDPTPQPYVTWLGGPSDMEETARYMWDQQLAERHNAALASYVEGT